MTRHRASRARLIRLLAVLALAAGLPALQPSQGSPPQGAGGAGPRPLPGAGRIAPDPELADAIRRLDPAADGWDSEVFSEAAEKQLEAIGRELASSAARSAPPAPAGLAGVADPGVVVGPLRPASLRRVSSSAVFTILRPEAGSLAAGTASALKGLDGFARALADLAAPLKGAGDARAEFLLFHVEVKKQEADTRAYLYLYGRPETGARQINATLRLRWSRPAGAPPRLTRLDLEDYEEVARPPGRGPLYSDVTASALGANASYRELLVPGVDDWLGRMEAWIESDSFGHHGMAVGDVNGDGLDDLYVCQFGGLPNLLFVQNPDGTMKDVSAESGVDWLERTRSALLIDLDNDGDQDLVAATSVSLLFMANDGAGRFTVKAALSALEGVVSEADSAGPAAPAGSGGVPVGGEQSGHYYRGPDLGGVQTSDLVMLAAADYDADGDLDVYACTYHATSEEASGFPIPVPYHDAANGGRDVLLRNDGDWVFSNATKESGLDVKNTRFSFAAAWEDYDNDGDQDLFVANDFGRKNLYRNDGGRFQEVAPRAGVEDVGAGMSVSWADYDGDGWMDLYVGNMFSAAGSRIASQRAFKRDSDEPTRALYRRHARGNSLYRNLRDGTFKDVSEEAGVTMGRWAWSSNFLDFDNDGREDLLVANGYFSKPRRVNLDSLFWRRVVMLSPEKPVEPAMAREYKDAWTSLGRLIRQGWSFAGRERNVAFLNSGGPRFGNASAVTGLDFAEDGRAVATVDHDLDGDLDVWTTSRTSPRIRLLRNDSEAASRFVAFLLQGSSSNRDAIGARLELHRAGPGAGGPLIRTLRAGEGYLGQSSKWVHFGLGETAALGKLVVRWPGGRAEEFKGLSPGRRYRIVQGGGRAEEWTPPARSIALTPAAGAPAPGGAPSRTFLSAPVPAPTLQFEDLDGRQQTLGDAEAGAVVVTFWVSGCEPCREQLVWLGRAAGDLAGRGVRILALNADGAGGEENRPSGSEAVKADLKRASLPFTTGFASSALVDKFQLILNKVILLPSELPAPVSFLIDPDGLLGGIYRGPVTVEQILADVALLRTSGERRLARAIPFPGRRQTRAWPPFFDYMDRVAEAYVEGGYPDEAEAYYRKVARIKPQATQPRFGLAMAMAAQGRVDDAVAEYRAVIAIDPRHVSALNNLGYLLAGQSRRDEAIELYRRALEVEPDNVSTLNNLGAALADAGRLDEAIASYRHALAVAPDNTPALNNVAVALARQGRDAEAIESYRRLLTIDPSSVPARLNLGMALLRQAKPEEAIEILVAAVRMKPDMPEAHYHLGVALSGQGRFDEAVERLTEAVRLRPGYARALYHLSLGLARQGKLEEASRRLSEAMQQPAEASSGAERLAWILATSTDDSLRHGAHAVTLAERVCAATGREQPGPLDTLAAAYAETGRFTEAAATARQAAALARAAGDAGRAAQIEARARLYESGRPFREGGEPAK